MTTISTAVQGVFRKMNNFIGNQSGQIITSNASQSGGVVFGINSNILQSEDNVRVRMLIYFDDVVTKALLHEVDQAAREVMEEVLRPITRSGELLASFQYKTLVRNRQLLIYSDMAAASAIENGFQSAVPIQRLMDWMETKAEFAGLFPQEQMNIAYAIKHNIQNGIAPGPNSTLGLLSGGERRYDYMTLAANKLNTRIEYLLEEFAMVASG